MNLDRDNKMKKRFYVIAAATALILIFVQLAGGENTNEMKAKFIVQMLDNTIWPENNNINSQNEVVIYLVGDSSLAPDIRNQANILYKNFKISVSAKTIDDDLTGCHILCIASDSLSHLAQVLKKVSDLPIVTIGQTAGFGRHGVMVNMREMNGEDVIYSINNMAAKVVGLKFNSGFIEKAAKTYG
jgi:hypothetical protein